MRTIVSRGMPLAAAALLGGGIAVAVGTAVGGGGTTTIVRQIDGSAAPATQFARSAAGLSIQDIYKSAGTGVVQVTATQVVSNDPFFGPQEATTLGSGFVIDKAGHIVTNFHVVEGAREVQVSFSGNDRIKARVVGIDPSTDLAVLQVGASARALTPLPLGDSDVVEVGDAVVAIGNPLGLDRTVTAGIVSALQREIQSPNGYTIDHVIQTDAAINEGNSGGPLLDASGEVIGVNSQIATRSGGNDGIGFAVPINTVREVVSQILQRGKVEHAWLGVEMETIDFQLAQTFRLPADSGVLIARVNPGGPADSAGLRGGGSSVVVDGQTYVLGGDIVTYANGRRVLSADELRAVITSLKPGDRLVLRIVNSSGTRIVTVKLGRQPTTPAG